jgi:hypothetical protein
MLLSRLACWHRVIGGLGQCSGVSGANRTQVSGSDIDHCDLGVPASVRTLARAKGSEGADATSGVVTGSPEMPVYWRAGGPAPFSD